ncbi:MAG: A/G-specific adenine glycosylase [Candidatus Limnocylindrales bacterium]
MTGNDSDARVRNAALLDWFDRHGRELSFRTTGHAPDPWAVLVSEVMLQQTQASRVEAHWRRFMTRFPRPTDLAEATPADVVRAWAGLGYNGRALRLQRTARALVERYSGSVPGDPDVLGRLPGIGPYTARAVAAIAFGRPVAALDTNIKRVLARVTGELVEQTAADGLVDRLRPAEWTHAMMDVGATLCRPRTPDCRSCPLARWCRCAAEGPCAGQVSRTRPAMPRFPSTTRWLRGRIIDRLRTAEDEAWVHLDAPMGEHGIDRISAAVAALERDGLLERRPDGSVRLPSQP